METSQGCSGLGPDRGDGSIHTTELSLEIALQAHDNITSHPAMKRRASNASDETKPSNRIDKPFKVRSYFRKFCSSTSLHGFQYLGDNSRSALERICWVIAVLVSIMACIWLIFNVYMKWVNSPVIVSFAETTTKVRDIPFPAVTICSGNKVRKSVFDFNKTVFEENFTEEVIEKMGFSSILCPFIAKQVDFNETVDHRGLKFLEEAGTPLEDMLDRCTWRNKEVPCEDIFTTVLTDAGLCHTFNTIGADDMISDNVDRNQFVKHLNHSFESSSWTVESGYTGPLNESYPFRSASSGSKEGLSFFYKQNMSELSDSCGFPGFGFKVIVHSPDDFPQVASQYFRMPPKHDVVVGVDASMIITSKGLQKNLKPNQRRCFMSNERDLYYFKIYTADNCEFECYINASLINCNCSSFYMPRAPNTTICGAGSSTCLDEVLGDLHLQEGIENCNCLPSCSEIQYNMEISETKVVWKLGLFPNKENDTETGRMQIYFKRNRFITRLRSELYGTTDFIANCGGLLGLFLGFSFLSLVEVIFFLIIRPLALFARSWYMRGRVPSMKQS